MSITERLPHLDKEQLENLLANAKRLQSQPGTQGDAAKELLGPLEAELASRTPKAAPKARAKPAAKAGGKLKAPGLAPDPAMG